MRILILLSLISLECVRADAWTWTMSSAIPDNDPSGMQNTQSVSGYTEVIESISVRLRLSGDPLAFGGDLFVSLQSENGGYAVLLNRVGRSAGDSFGYDTNGFDVTFAIGGNDIHRYRDFAYSYNGDDALVGTWGADARNIDPDHVLDSDARTRDLDQFAGINPNGNWTLFVADLSPNGVARLEAWGLEIHVIPEPGALLLAGILLGSAGMAAAVRRNFRVSGPCRWKSVCVLRCHSIGGSATSNQKKSSGKYGTGGAGNPGGNFEREGLQCGTEKTGRGVSFGRGFGYSYSCGTDSNHQFCQTLSRSDPGRTRRG